MAIEVFRSGRMPFCTVEEYDYWRSLLVSAAESSLAERRIAAAIMAGLHREFGGPITDRNAIFADRGKQIKYRT